MSTIEAESIAITELFKEEKWLNGLVGEMCPMMNLVHIYCDNESAIHLAGNQNTFHRRTKHIDIKFNFV